MSRHVTFVSRPMRVPGRAEGKYYPGSAPFWEDVVCPLLQKLGLDQLATMCEVLKTLQ